METPTPIDNLTEKTFRLLGTLQTVDIEDVQWQKEFIAALTEQQDAVRPFAKAQN